jgi:hypothetical protein
MPCASKKRQGRAIAVPVMEAVLRLCLPVIAAGVGCVDIQGGAVEVSWAVFARDGRKITDCSCADPPIAYVRLNLMPDPDDGTMPCAGMDGCRFPCGRMVGATPFTIRPGDYLMSLVPVGVDGLDLSPQLVQSPAPEFRSVVRGQPTELEAFMLQTSCATRCNSQDITRPCSGG